MFKDIACGTHLEIALFFCNFVCVSEFSKFFKKFD